MFESNQSSTAPDILKRMARAPFVVFLFVARADGSLDKKEADRLANLMQSDEFAILATAVEQAGTTCDKALLDVMLSSKTTPLDELSELNNLLAVRVSQSNTTDVKVAIWEYKVTLLKLARRIAEASGGLLGILGNKIGKEEKAVLDVIAQALGMVPDGELSDAQANPVEIPEEIIFPALRPMAWAEARRGRFAMRSLYEGSDAQSNDPIVAYVIDRAEDVEVISNARLTGSMTMDRLHVLAMTNLEKRLLENSKWDETNFDNENETVGTISGLVLHGDYFCSEALLSKTLLKQAHERLDARVLMVIAPHHGELYAAPLLSEDKLDQASSSFATSVLVRCFQQPGDPISNNIWVVRNGQLVGHVYGMHEIVTKARAALKANSEQNENELVLSEDLHKYLEAAFKDAAEFIETGDDPFIPFVMMWNDNAPVFSKLKACMSDDYTEAVKLGWEIIEKDKSSLVGYAFAWSGYYGQGDDRKDAIYIEASDINAPKTVTLAITYKVIDGKFQRIESVLRDVEDNVFTHPRKQQA